MSNKVAKAIIIDQDNNYLLMYRNNHPTFGDDPDLPGGTHEDDETMLTTMLREVYEESDIRLDPAQVKEIYAGTDYSLNGTFYSLYVAPVTERPLITLSWEQKSYHWVSRDVFLDKIKDAKDTYMHMVYDVLQKTTL